MDWSARYARYGRMFGESPSPFVSEVFSAPDDFGVGVGREGGPRLLVPGDGYGRNGIWLAERGYSVTAFDLAANAVRIAQLEAAAKAVDYVSRVADLEDPRSPLCSSSRFQGIASIWFRLGSSAAQRRWNLRCVRHLDPGGFIVSVTSPEVTSVDAEKDSWGPGITWREFSTETEIRVVGIKGDAEGSVG